MKRSDGGDDVDSLVPKLKVEISNKTKNVMKRKNWDSEGGKAG